MLKETAGGGQVPPPEPPFLKKEGFRPQLGGRLAVWPASWEPGVSLGPRTDPPAPPDLTFPRTANRESKPSRSPIPEPRSVYPQQGLRHV